MKRGWKMKRVSTVTVRKRLVTVFLVGLLLFAIIDFRRGYVQFSIGDQLMDKANEPWSRDITFESDRGKILDTEGDDLDENVYAPSLTVVPGHIKHPHGTTDKLASILDMPTDKAYEYVTKNESSVNTHPEARKINEEQEAAILTLNLDGVYLAKDSKRHYPYDDYLSHVLGFTGIDNQGLMGLELYYDDKLKGEKGSLSYYSDAK